MNNKIEIPRRNCIDQWTPSEKAIYDAIKEVEKAGADQRLTNAIIHLQQAKEFVSDYVDRIPERKGEESNVIHCIDSDINPIIGRVYFYQGIAIRCLERGDQDDCSSCYLLYKNCSHIQCSERTRQDGQSIMFREVER